MADEAKRMPKARKQVSQPIGPQRDKESRGNYNIWYNKYSGERHSQSEKLPSSSRCCISKDAGETRGSLRDDTAYVCLKFARGCCPLGYECSWLHVAPTVEFDAKLDVTRDCFGRERHEDVREDQSGVGSFSADSETARTLYVGGMASPRSSIHETVYRHFSEWGKVENVRVLEAKGVAFVRYKCRASAEFAREAMQRQPLDNNEVLNIRWATADPNPWVAKRKQQRNEKTLERAVVKSLPDDGPWVDRHGGPPQKRHRSVMTHKGQAVEEYPNTDHQYEKRETFSNYRVPGDQGAGHAQPKSLSDLVEWSKKQVTTIHAPAQQNENVVLNSGSSLPGQTSENTKGLTSLLCAYDSSSSDEET